MTDPAAVRHLTKDEINLLPLRRYEGRVHLARSPAEAESAAAALAAEPLLGFDTETRPSFRVGESYLPSLLQLASAEGVHLFQLRSTGLVPGLRGLLASPTVVKAGVSIRPDVAALRQLADFVPSGLVDLGEVARRAGLANLGLRGLAALLLGFRVSKRERASNWARSQLTPAQIAYAATDAWLGREIYLALQARGLLGGGAAGRQE